MFNRDKKKPNFRWYMYIDKMKIDDISTQFTTEIIQKILNLVLKNTQKITIEIKFDEKSVSIINSKIPFQIRNCEGAIEKCRKPRITRRLDSLILAFKHIV